MISGQLKFKPELRDYLQIIAGWLHDKMQVIDGGIDFIQCIVNCLN